MESKPFALYRRRFSESQAALIGSFPSKRPFRFTGLSPATLRQLAWRSKYAHISTVTYNRSSCSLFRRITGRAMPAHLPGTSTGAGNRGAHCFSPGTGPSIRSMMMRSSVNSGASCGTAPADSRFPCPSETTTMSFALPKSYTSYVAGRQDGSRAHTWQQVAESARGAGLVSAAGFSCGRGCPFRRRPPSHERAESPVAGPCGPSCPALPFTIRSR